MNLDYVSLTFSRIGIALEARPRISVLSCCHHQISDPPPPPHPSELMKFAFLSVLLGNTRKGPITPTVTECGSSSLGVFAENRFVKYFGVGMAVECDGYLDKALTQNGL